MAATVAECARWLGIPDEQLELLVQHPAVSRALLTVRAVYQSASEPEAAFEEVMARSGLHPEQICAQHDLPVIDPDGLDVERLRQELTDMRVGP